MVINRYSFADIILSVMNTVFTLAIVALVLRFLLRLFGANPAAGFTEFIYDSTQPLLYPFRNIFEPVFVDNNSVLEFSTLFAIFIYILVAYLVAEFIAFVDYRSSKTYRK